jgi:hypothetical protein
MINPLSRATRGRIRIGTNNNALVLASAGILFFVSGTDRLFYAMFDLVDTEQYEWIETSKSNFRYWDGAQYITGTLKRWNGTRWV